MVSLQMHTPTCRTCQTTAVHTCTIMQLHVSVHKHTRCRCRCRPPPHPGKLQSSTSWYLYLVYLVMSPWKLLCLTFKHVHCLPSGSGWLIRSHQHTHTNEPSDHITDEGKVFGWIFRSVSSSTSSLPEPGISGCDFHTTYGADLGIATCFSFALRQACYDSNQMKSFDKGLNCCFSRRKVCHTSPASVSQTAAVFTFLSSTSTRCLFYSHPIRYSHLLRCLQIH